MFHPSAAGYALAANQLLPALCNALGESDRRHGARSAVGVADGRGSSLLARLDGVSRLLRRRTTGVPAPIVVPAS